MQTKLLPIIKILKIEPYYIDLVLVACFHSNIRGWEHGMELPAILQRGERARLFPVLADTSKEGRTLSIFLACLENVDEFNKSLLATIGQKIGTRSKIETYTEVVLVKGGDKSHRPDGLIVIKNGSRQWSALVEAKVGNADLTNDQIESYADLAKINNIDAIITLSNQFASLPTHHPIQLPVSLRRKVEIFHWSWMHVVTQASLLISNDQVSDRDQKIILNEMIRFLTHPSAGVKSFEQMPSSWSDLVGGVQAGAKISANSMEAKEVVGAWHQELRDLTLILSRQLGAEVMTRISRPHAADPSARLKDASATLATEQCLTGTLLVPGAAAPIEICADLQKRSVSVSMKLRAPSDKKSTKARLNWLLKQIQKTESNGVHIRLLWPGRGAHSQYTLQFLRDNPETSSAEKPGQTVLSFEVLLVKDLGARFGQRRNFISELEGAIPEFYIQVGQHLRAWQPPAPRIRDDKSEPESVSAEALNEEAEQVAYGRDD